MKDWNKINEASGLHIPDLARITASLDALEAAFRPLVKTIPHDVEPAIALQLPLENRRENKP